jgi:4-alpha-glucanotransferase
MDNLDTREWLLTNGLGSFANSTVSDAHTRTYHGWLIAALEPPAQRTLLLSRIDAALEINEQVIELGVNFWKSGAVSPQGFRLLQSFQADPVPIWTWGQSHWQLSRRLLMPHGFNKLTSGELLTTEPSNFCSRLLVQYRYQGEATAVLRLRPLIADRIFHYQQQAEERQFIQVNQPGSVIYHARPAGTAWRLCWTQGTYFAEGIWYWGYRYPEETQRGLSDTEDLYNPGCLVVRLNPGDSVTLEASVGDVDLQAAPVLDAECFEQAFSAEQQRLTTAFTGSASHPLRWRLLKAGDQFLVYRASIKGPTVIAGYPWFNDWGRDTLIALPGLTLTTRRFDLAKGLLRMLGQYCEQGLIPNAFPDSGSKPFYNTLDAALWWIETLGLYLEASQDWQFLVEQYAIVWNIYKRLMAGTLYGIRVDAFDGLVTWDAADVALTWMDAVVDGTPVTPRRGKPVEINALWYSALCWAWQWAERLQQASQSVLLNFDAATLSNQARRYSSQAEQVKLSLQKFYQPATGYLCDTIQPDDLPDFTIRPNAVIALSLQHCGFSESVGQQVLQVAQARLLTPYGLRSLDPADPQYLGSYRGGIWQRDQAYHQGSVWPWLIGPFTRAWQRFYPNQPVPFDWQPLLEHFQHQGCLDSISEMFDGNPPHLPKGAIAQAWSVAEMIRYWQGH